MYAIRSYYANRFLVGPERIDVVYNGANNTYKPLSGEEVQVTRDTYTRGKPYFLFLSLVHPRKNLTRIIAAYNQFREKTSAGVLLLVVGSTKYWTDDTREAWEQSPYSDDIIFTGRLNGEALNHVMASCLALVYASLFEGFGIPILDRITSYNVCYTKLLRIRGQRFYRSLFSDAFQWRRSFFYYFGR